MEDANDLQTVDIAKVRSRRVVGDYRITPDVDKRAVGEKSATSTEGIGLDIEWFEGMRVEIVEGPPGGMSVDGERVMLHLVD